MSSLPAKRKKELTELEAKFLEALFGEAEGDANKAKKLAGYADSVKSITLVRQLREEIAELSLDILAAGGPKAAMALVNLVSNPTTPGADNIIKAANQVLDRSGAVKKQEETSIKINGGGLFILPAKGTYIEPTTIIDVTDVITLNEDEYSDGN